MSISTFKLSYTPSKHSKLAYVQVYLNGKHTALVIPKNVKPMDIINRLVQQRDGIIKR